MKNIYLDYASTTPVAEEVLEQMIKYLGLKNNFGNPASRHQYGWETNDAINIARQNIANILSADSAKEILFTSGATESNNMAIKGISEAYYNKGKHIITSSIEHKAILDPIHYLKKKGYTVTYLFPDKYGQIYSHQILKAITENTILVSIMFVHNELGTCYPIKEIGKLCKQNNIIFHVDAAQGFGKFKINVNEMNIDLLSISGHKIYGPKGIGVLYLRKKTPKIKLNPLIHGGGHENGFRAGTLATHQIIGLATAASLMDKKRVCINNHVKKLRDIFLKKLKVLKNITINTPLLNSYPGIVSITFNNIDGESLVARLHNLSFSMGSACNSFHIEPSFVLLNIGLNPDQAHSTLRFSFGMYTTIKEIIIATKSVIVAVNNIIGND